MPTLSDALRIVKNGTGGQYRLDPARQLTLDGKAEPLLAVELDQAEQVAQPVSPAQLALFEHPQPEFPFHAPVDGRPPKECLRGFREKGNAHAHDLGDARRMVPECCALQRCESSREGNDAERSRDLFNGTKRKAGKGERIGLRHILGAAALCVLVVTLPQSLRALGKNPKAALKAWERAVVRELTALLAARIGWADAEFYIRAYMHPCGEDGTTWHPHLNLLIPAWAWISSEGRAKRFKPFVDVAMVREAMARAQAKVFGDGSGVNCFWKYEQDEPGKKHQAGYVPRTFPQWAHLKLRPASYGMAHPKKRAELVEALDGLKMLPLPEWASVPLLEGFESAPISGQGATAEAAREDYSRQLAMHRAFCRCGGSASSYPEHRRTMTPVVAGRATVGRVAGPAPPETGPPIPSPDASGRWAALLALPS
jgi:hypothetical protein